MNRSEGWEPYPGAATPFLGDRKGSDENDFQEKLPALPLTPGGSHDACEPLDEGL